MAGRKPRLVVVGMLVDFDHFAACLCQTDVAEFSLVVASFHYRSYKVQCVLCEFEFLVSDFHFAIQWLVHVSVPSSKAGLAPRLVGG